jgi:hypothetical protein
MRFKDLLIFAKGKDGGPESKVHGYWLFRSKSLFTIALLRFDHGSREAYHSHAFNSISWVLKGALYEMAVDKDNYYEPSLKPIITKRETLHKVYGVTPHTWVLTFRGPWVDTWHEIVDNKRVTLTHDRVEL